MSYYQIKDLAPHLKNPHKYKGTHPITMRSGWEIRLAQWMDKNDAVLEWASETVVVPYLSPIDKQWHRYFVDFWMKYRRADGTVKEVLLEVKPHKDTVEPTVPTKKTRRYYAAVYRWLKNSAKWKAATQMCENLKAQGRDIEFTTVTEKDFPQMTG